MSPGKLACLFVPRAAGDSQDKTDSRGVRDEGSDCNKRRELRSNFQPAKAGKALYETFRESEAFGVELWAPQGFSGRLLLSAKSLKEPAAYRGGGHLFTVINSIRSARNYIKLLSF